MNQREARLPECNDISFTYWLDGTICGVSKESDTHVLIEHELGKIHLTNETALGLAYALVDKAGCGYLRGLYLQRKAAPFLLRLKYALLLLLGDL